MPPQPLTRQISKMPLKVPLRLVLVVPFLLQIFATVGLVGWLSFRAGQQAVNDLATQLQIEVNERIQNTLHSYLETPHLVNQINVDAVRQGFLDLKNPRRLERYLWNQMQQFKTASYVGIATESGNYVGANRFDDGSIDLDILDQTTQGKLLTWSTDGKGNHIDLLKTRNNYNPKVRPWYQAGVKAKKPVWSEIYPYFTSKALVISANQPIYDEQGNLLGVASTDLTLARISEFLGGLKIGKTGQTFIIERDGLLVATSTQEGSFRLGQDQQQPERLKVTLSENPLTKATADYLIANFGNFSEIKTPLQLTFYQSRQRQFLKVTPLIDSRGINWLIIVVVPESDFMEQVHANIRITIVLCLFAFLFAALLGILTSRWISTPIFRLSAATRAIANGEFSQTFETQSINELEILANSFNQMSHQLQASFAALEKTNAELEKRVEERTAELWLEKEKSEQLLLNILPKAIAEQLKQDGTAVASAMEEVTILFADIVGFTPLAAQMPPIEVVNLLNYIFSSFDQLAEKHGLEKIKTIGDAYMVVGGLPIPRQDHAEAIADMALDMQVAISHFVKAELNGNPSQPFEMRIGINSGPVVAGVIGIKKFLYDLWGDTVNVAARMESSGIPGGIQITEATYQLLKDKYLFNKRGTIEVKGKGQMTTYWLLAKKLEDSEVSC